MNSIPPQTRLCRQNDSLLLVIDIQPKLADAMPPEVQERVLKQAGLLLRAASLLEIPVFATEQYPQGLGHLAPEFQAHLPESAGVFDKTCFSCCGASRFTGILRESGRQQAILAGMETHVCVLQTALELQQEGFEVFVAEDACASRLAANAANAAHRMRQTGVAVTVTESVLFEWVRDARHAQFKTVSKLLR